MDTNAAERQYQELRSEYCITISEFLDLGDLAGFPNEAGGERKPWLVCLIPEAVQQLILVGGVRSRFPMRTIDRLWRLAGKVYSDLELYSLFREAVRGRSLDPLFNPIMRKTAGVCIEQGETEEPFDPVVPLCMAIYEAKVAQEAGVQPDHSLSAMTWADLTQVLMRRLAADDHSSDEDRELSLARDLGL